MDQLTSEPLPQPFQVTLGLEEDSQQTEVKNEEEEEEEKQDANISKITEAKPEWTEAERDKDFVRGWC